MTTTDVSIYDFDAVDLEGRPAPLSAYRGKVLLIVNTASKCGFTPQYEGLEAMWRAHRDEGLVVLGFPCNQFGAQEPGDAQEIANFCSLTYDVTFPMMAKVEVNGPAADPLFAYLKHQKKGLLGSEAIKWNFTKFLIGRDGTVLARFAPTDTPQKIEAEVKKALSMAEAFDVVVVGAGPGGYVAAIRASQLGLKTAIVEREALGGICLNWGCIPTKALLRSGEAFESLSHLGDLGISADNPAFDFAKVVQRSRKVAQQLSAGVAFLMKKHRIAVLDGVARLEPGEPAPRVVVALKSGGEQRIEPAKAVILATGARARTIPAAGLVPDGERIWTYREAMVPAVAPASLVVVGSGAIGIEFASFYRALGAQVTVVEALDRILPLEDEEISAEARKAFEKRGIAFRIGAKVTGLEATKAGVALKLEVGGKAETLEAERAIVAVGIQSNLENLGVEALGLKVERGVVAVSAGGATNVPGLWAIGDVAGPPALAHKAMHEGVRCAEAIAGHDGPHVEAPVPACTYASPQVASVGLTEAQAKAAGREPKVGRFPFRVNGKAIASGETVGFVKTVFDGRTGALIGAHMIGAEVTEMIQGFCLAMTLEATEAEIFATIFPHPTMSEAMHEASLAAYGRALHI